MEKAENSLIAAIIAGAIDQVKKLLDGGADPNEANEVGYTALQHAIWLGHVEIIKLLLAYHAHINEHTYLGNTALHTATWYGYRKIEDTERTLLQIVELLLTHRADPNSKNMFGLTSLHHTAYYGHANTLQMLIQYGADVDNCVESASIVNFRYDPKHLDEFKAAQIADGMTPLHIAVKQNHYPIVKILLSHQADRHKKDSLNNLAIDYAKENNNQTIIDIYAVT